MAMDREEKLGLGAAVGGHALLVIGLALGLFMTAKPIIEPPNMAVTLVSEDASPSPSPASSPEPEQTVSEPTKAEREEPVTEDDSAADEAAATALLKERAAQDAADQKRAAQAKAKAEAAARAAAEAKAAALKASATAAEIARAKEAAKRAEAARQEAAAAKLRQQQQAAALAKKRAAEDAKRRADAEAKRLAEAKRKASANRELADAISKLGTSGAPKTANVAATKKAKAKIGNQIRIRGCPDGIEADRIVTTVTINLNSNGTIASLSNIAQQGRTDSNAAQMEPTKRCVLESIRAAAPFTGLDPTEFESWKSIRIGFKAS
jgi:colicin import membrane protein